MSEEQLAVNAVLVRVWWALEKSGMQRDLHITGTKEYEWWGARCEALAGELKELQAYEQHLAGQGAEKP